MVAISILAVITIAISCYTISAHAEWRVDIESKEVQAGTADVAVDVTAYWDIGLRDFVVPLIVREIDSTGAFWSGTLPYDTSGIAGYHPYAHGVAWGWSEQWALITEEVRPLVRMPDDPVDPTPPPSPMDPPVDEPFDP